MSIFSHPDDLFLFTTAVIGFLSMKKSSPIYLKLLPLFLLTIIVIEWVGRYIYKPGENNLLLYNILSVYEFLFYCYYLFQIIDSRLTKNTIVFVSFLSPVILVYNLLYFQGVHQFTTLTFIPSSILLIIFGLIYIYQIFNKAELVDLKREPSFWICISLIFYFSVTVSILGNLNYISTLSKSYINLSHSILLTVNCFHYLLFLIAFICPINIRKFTHNF
jgi:hypothetical protein